MFERVLNTPLKIKIIVVEVIEVKQSIAIVVVVLAEVI